MAYADQQMSGNRITAFIIVALLHLVLGYALVTGLAYEGVKQIMKKVTTIDIKKDEPKKEPPPIIAPPAPVPAPPPPRFQPKSATPKGNPANWATTNDYPSRALREEREGTTGFRVTVGPDGRVTSCDVTSSSGSSDLDDATCANVTRRARFTPAMDGEGNPTSGSYSNRIRWVIPKD